ncbi:hypothetical protein H072_10842 [Dactylellina haptotyla CBS 200.50]|uniref:Ima1 N-terminal domain-containing protein n=1 Tax=Dactylellina haptotyla (strain CBS 200.50) TaxID=1284197 RepID=S7ZY98_DACHA|nr:hypothetical protein H072_10842 [Dactylellina haptotyla CBS 200.50]
MLRSSKTKVSCFYCNKPSYIPRPRAGPIRRFECPQCLATNNLNENGEITDPIPTPDKPFIRYAYEVKAPGSRRIKQDVSVCCRSCENNHAIIVQQLANYLPDESDPNYEYLAEHISDFRRQLEEKYPPLCGDCAPKVNDRLRQINYKAKTQGLGRLLENTNKMVRSNKLAQPKSPLMALLDIFMVLGWYLWGAAYWACILILMFWQFNVSLVAMPSDSIEELDKFGWSTCIKGSLMGAYLKIDCYGVSSRWVGYLFPWALCLSFYNYKWMEVRRSPGSYVEDWLPYLLCQLVVATFMGLSWWFLGPGGLLKSEKEIIILSNSCLLIEVLLLWVAFTSLKVTHPVRTISLKESRPALTGDLIAPAALDQEPQGGMPFRPNQRVSPASQNRHAYTNPATVPYHNSQASQSQPWYGNYQSPSSSYNQQPTLLPAADPDAMDWNPSFNEPDFSSSQQSLNNLSFSQHRPTSPLGYYTSQTREDYNGNSSDEDNDDAKTEVNDSPMKQRSAMRPKSLLIDGLMNKHTGLESLFEVAAKLDEAKPMNQPGILAKRAHRVSKEAARLLAVYSGLILLVSSGGPPACAGLFLAFMIGTGTRFVDAAFNSESRILSIGQMWKRIVVILVCLLEFAGSLVVSAEMLGFIAPAQLISSSTVNMPTFPALTLDITPTDTALPILSDGTIDLGAIPPAAPLGQTQLVKLIMRMLFFSLASQQTWAFGKAALYKGTHVVEEEKPTFKRRNSRDLGVSEPVGGFMPNPNRIPSPSFQHKPSPPSSKPTATGFGGLSLGGGGLNSNTGGTLTNRSNFSSWGKRTDSGVKTPTPERFGATTTRSMKVPPAGMHNTPNPWNSQGGSYSSQQFNQPRGTGTWGL